MRRAGVLGVALLAIAAAPPSGFNTAPTVPPIVTVRPRPPPDLGTPPGFAPAPLPDRDANAPYARASPDATVMPNLITRRDQYRGEGINAASSAQARQDQRAKPGGGINLSVPLQ